MRKVAIFDVDGTVFRSSLLIEIVETLIDKGVFPQSARTRYQKQSAAWLNRTGTYEEYIAAVVESFMEHIKGVHYGELQDATEAMLSEHQQRVYRYTRDLILELKKKKYFLLAVSQSPKAILDKFCEVLGFDKVYGRFYEIGPQDRFTGVITDLHLIANKANVVKRAVEKEGLSLTDSVGVGDTEGDIAFLELVEQPICFNPNAKLYQHAKRMGWPIVVERKDVIYEL